MTRVLQFRRQKLKVNADPVALKPDKIIGRSRSLGKCLNQGAQAGVTDVGVLISGATGTGKELFAKSVYWIFYTTKEHGQGTGLGLSTVYGIVKQNRGFLRVESVPGQGTTLKIYLPRSREENQERSETVKREAVATGTETILLVEDEAMILEMTTMMLQGQGYRVLPAATPGEAIRLAEAHGSEIGLLISDLVMPEMNSRDLAEKLMTFNPRLKRLFMSGYTASVIARHGVLEEGIHFIQKPFSRSAIAAKAREVPDHPPVIPSPQIAAEMSQASAQVKISAEELSGIAEQLKAMMAKFKT